MTEPNKVITMSEWDNKYACPEDLIIMLKIYDKFSDPLYDPHDVEKRSIIEGPKSPLKKKQSLSTALVLDLTNPSHQNVMESKLHLEKVCEALDNIKKNARDYEDNITQIENIKESVIKKINEFYDESSRLIDQEKNLIDTVVHIQTILHYYQDFQKLTKDVDNLSNNIANIHIYAQNIQRFLSEIIDALEFFASKPKYKNSKEFIDKFKRLKNQLLVVIKKMFVKIFTEDYKAIVNKLESFQFQKLFPNSNNNSNSSIVLDVENNTDLLKIIYPEYITYLSNDYNINLENTLKNRYVNKILKNLLVYLKSLSNFDPDCSSLLRQLFHEFYGFSRGKIQEMIVEKIHDHIYTTQVTLKNELHIMLRKTIAISLQMTFFELSYHNHFFNNTVLLTDSNKIGEVLGGINELYHTYLKPYILKENNLEILLECLDILNYYINPEKLALKQSESLDSPIIQNEFAQDILDPQEKLAEMKMNNLSKSIFMHLVYPDAARTILDHQKNLLENDISNFQKFSLTDLDFLKAIRQDVTNRMLITLYSYINDHIINFNSLSYFKDISSKYSLNQSGSATDGKEPNTKPSYFNSETKKEILPLINTTASLLYNLQNRIDDKHFQHTVNMVIGTTVNYIYLGCENFQGKIDSFLFLMKNLIAFDQLLFQKNIEVNWTIEVQDPKNEIGFFDKLRSNFNFFSNVSKKMSSKLQDFNSDLKMPVHIHIERIADVLIDDVTFMISKHLREYLKRYNYLEEQLKKKEDQIRERKSSFEESKGISQNKIDDSQILSLTDVSTISNKIPAGIESIKKDLASLFTKDAVEKYYLLYTDNMRQYMAEIADKMSKYMDENCQQVMKDYIEVIIQNLMTLLHQFYILVSKVYPNESYNDFKFVESDKVKEKLYSFFSFINSKNNHMKTSN